MENGKKKEKKKRCNNLNVMSHLNPSSTHINPYALQELNLDDFISHEIKFEDVNKAFDLLQQGKSLRCIMWMDK